MAPRGRRPKKKHQRMDAAVETMEMEYGISDVELIKKVANELLDAYGGGDEAWYFIELYTYQELLEAIVRYREENPQENNWPVNSAGGGDSDEVGTAENHAPENAAGPSSLAVEPICSEVVETGLLKGEDDTNLVPSTEMDGKGWKDIGLDLSSSQRNSGNAVRDTAEDSGSNEDVDAGSMSYAAQLVPTTSPTSSVASRLDVSTLLSPSPTTANTAPPRRRLPCYGWIENDEEDVDDFIDLKPAKTAARRRSRWDLKPGDP